MYGLHTPATLAEAVNRGMPALFAGRKHGIRNSTADGECNSVCIEPRVANTLTFTVKNVPLEIDLRCSSEEARGARRQQPNTAAVLIYMLGHRRINSASLTRHHDDFIPLGSTNGV